MNYNFSQKTKVELLTALKGERNAFNQSSGGQGIIDFFTQVFNLRAMPSTDPRYKDALSDFYQHLVNNDDWTIEYILFERLTLSEVDNDLFARVIETILKPENREGEDEIMKFVLLINPYLEADGYKLALSEYDDQGRPIYKILTSSEFESLPSDMKVNSVPFYVYRESVGRASSGAHNAPAERPSFSLVFNSTWNDYSAYTEFFLFYHDELPNAVLIGRLKIISNLEGSVDKLLPSKFKILSDKFCSLGQHEDYYKTLKEKFPKDFESLLYSLQDVAFFSEIREKFEKLPKYKSSLIRYDTAERIARQMKYNLYDYDLKNLYKFKYAFQPVYADSPVDVEFNFDAQLDVPNRIYAVIGKNGAGKTQLISSLPLNISKKHKESFYPKIPLFSKVIAVSYSIFDSFDIPRKTATFNYVYCGLRNEKRELITERGLVLRFHNSWKAIEAKGRINQWRSILSNFIDEEILDEFLIPQQSAAELISYKVSVEGFGKIKQRLSSGQSIVLYIITEIVANINFDSLILYDEPETHLHPNAITELMNTIYELVSEFQSYCIIGTHSPLVIRELLSKSVFVLDRVGNTPSLRKIKIESFGENISTLTEEVFGNKDTAKQYKSIIRGLVSHGRSFDEIVNILESDNVSLSLNTRIFIKSLLHENA